jgi:hypothetical protein
MARRGECKDGYGRATPITTRWRQRERGSSAAISGPMFFSGQDRSQTRRACHVINRDKNHQVHETWPKAANLATKRATRTLRGRANAAFPREFLPVEHAFRRFSALTNARGDPQTSIRGAADHERWRSFGQVRFDSIDGTQVSGWVLRKAASPASYAHLAGVTERTHREAKVFEQCRDDLAVTHRLGTLVVDVSGRNAQDGLFGATQVHPLARGP